MVTNDNAVVIKESIGTPMFLNNSKSFQLLIILFSQNMDEMIIISVPIL